MKKFYTLKLFLTVLFAAVFGTMSADVSSNFTDEKLTVGSGELGWTASIAAQQWDSQYDRGVQFGTSKSPVGAFTLTAGQSLTQVTSVSITASASGAGNTISVNVGGVEFTGDVTEIASGTQNANQVYTFTGPATDGVITITLNDNTKAVWVKSIAVACTETSVDGGGDTPEPPVGGDVTFFSETFADGQGDFTIDNVQEPAGGGYVWNHDSSHGYMKASCFIGGQDLAAESWLISPAIDLTKATAATLSFSHCANFFDGAVADALSVQVREQGGQWTKLDVSAWPAGNNWDWVDATADLSAYVGKTIEIAFVYTSQDGDAGTWEVKNVSVEGQGEAGEQPEPPVEEGVIFSETFAADQGDFTRRALLRMEQRRPLLVHQGQRLRQQHQLCCRKLAHLARNRPDGPDGHRDAHLRAGLQLLQGHPGRRRFGAGTRAGRRMDQARRDGLARERQLDLR